MQLTQLTPSISAQNPTVFNFNNSELRVFDRNGNPWFAAADIATIFHIANIRKRLDSLDEDERCSLKLQRGGTLTIVSESGMWTLVLRSDAALEKGTPAYKARKWVTSEVLPAIRKTGLYSTVRENRTVASLTPAQQLAIQQAVGRRAQKTANHYQTIYRAIKLRYQIARYDQLPQSLFEDCLRFIETVDLHTPEVVEHPSPLPVAHSEPKDPSRYLTDNELSSLDRIHRFHRDPYFKIAYEVAYNTLRAAQSRYAGRFYDVMTECDLSLFRIGRILERNGIEHF